jgi:hypothetical protein
MMQLITEKRLNVIFNQVIGLFSEECTADFSMPELVVEDLCEKEYNENKEAIFDCLGFFKCLEPNKIYLCKKNIEDYCKKNGKDVAIIAEIIAIHEIAHFIHFHLIPNIYCKPTNNEKEKIFLESFAQLITHKVCILLGETYLYNFNELKKCQGEEYTEYHVKDLTCEKLENYPKRIPLPAQLCIPMSKMPWKVIVKTFIKISIMPEDLSCLFIKNMCEYMDELSDGIWINDLCGSFTSEDADRLIDLGLCDGWESNFNMIREKYTVESFID